MKRPIFTILGIFVMVTTASADGENQFSDSYSFDEFVPCLGETLELNFEFSGIYHETYDANGGLHINMNGKLAGDFESKDTEKTWVGRGRKHLAVNSNMEWVPGGPGNNQMQFRRTNLEQLVVIADGQYPDLLWTFELTIVVNANFVITKIYSDFGTVSCLSD